MEENYEGLEDLFAEEFEEAVETAKVEGSKESVTSKEKDFSKKGIKEVGKADLDLDKEVEDSGILDAFLEGGTEFEKVNKNKTDEEDFDGGDDNGEGEEDFEIVTSGDIAQVLYDKHEFELPSDFNPEEDEVTEKVVYDMFMTNLTNQKELAKKEGEKLGSEIVLNSIRALNPEVQAMVSQAAKNPNQDFKSLVSAVNQDARVKAVDSLTIENDSIDIVKSYLEAEGNSPSFVKDYLEGLIEAGKVKEYASKYLEPLKTKLKTLQSAKQVEADKLYLEREAKDKKFVEGLSGYFSAISKGEGVSTKVILEDSKIRELFYSITKDEKVHYKGGEVTLNQLSSQILKLKESQDYNKLLKIAAIIKGDDDLLSSLIGVKSIKNSKKPNKRKKYNLRR